MNLDNTREVLIIGAERITGKSDKVKKNNGEYIINTFYYVHALEERKLNENQTRSYIGDGIGKFNLGDDDGAAELRAELREKLGEGKHLRANISGYYTDGQFRITRISTDIDD